MQLDFFYHNRTPSYASMSTISGHEPLTCHGCAPFNFSLLWATHSASASVLARCRENSLINKDQKLSRVIALSFLKSTSCVCVCVWGGGGWFDRTHRPTPQPTGLPPSRCPHLQNRKSDQYYNCYGNKKYLKEIQLP